MVDCYVLFHPEKKVQRDKLNKTKKKEKKREASLYALPPALQKGQVCGTTYTDKGMGKVPKPEH